MSVMALLALTAGVFLLQSTQTAQTRISQTDNKLMEEYEMKRTLINRTALDYRKYILYQGGTYNSLISSCVKSTGTFDPWKTDSYNGVNYSVSACDNTDADTVYTNDTDYFLWFKIDATFPDGRARTYYALMEPGDPNGCDLSVVTYLDSNAHQNNWTLTQGASTVASRTFTATHDLTTQTDYVSLTPGLAYGFTYNDTGGDGFSSSSYYFKLRNDAAAVDIFNKTDGTAPSSWSTCTATITMNSSCTNTTTINCTTPTPTPTPTPSGGGSVSGSCSYSCGVSVSSGDGCDYTLSEEYIDYPPCPYNGTWEWKTRCVVYSSCTGTSTSTTCPSTFTGYTCN